MWAWVSKYGVHGTDFPTCVRASLFPASWQWPDRQLSAHEQVHHKGNNSAKTDCPLMNELVLMGSVHNAFPLSVKRIAEGEVDLLTKCYSYLHAQSDAHT